MVDVTTICNQALAVVGTRSTISSITEESNEARACLLLFETTRRHLLRAAHWGFARAYSQFPLVRARWGTPEANPSQPVTTGAWNEAFEPPPPWLYAYGLPGDCIAVRYVQPAMSNSQPQVPFTSAPMDQFPAMGFGPMPKFELATSYMPQDSVPINVLVTNVQQAVVCYTRDISNTDLFEESFTRAFVNALGANMVTTLTGDLKMLDALTKLANSIILDARVKNSNEALNVIDAVPDWLRVRGVGPNVGTGPWVPEYGPLFGGSI